MQNILHTAQTPKHPHHHHHRRKQWGLRLLNRWRQCLGFESTNKLQLFGKVSSTPGVLQSVFQKSKSSQKHNDRNKKQFYFLLIWGTPQLNDVHIASTVTLYLLYLMQRHEPDKTPVDIQKWKKYILRSVQSNTLTSSDFLKVFHLSFAQSTPPQEAFINCFLLSNEDTRLLTMKKL